ncbi:MAG: methyltransferase domain-containing protein [Methylorubrum populi]
MPYGRTGVEIGPLTHPIVLKSDGAVLYADHLPTEALRRQYRGHPTLGPAGVDGIVPVDVVLGEGGLAQALGARGPVDYIVASHVVEHVPDPIRWLREAGDALREGGAFCLIVPDKRFTFDHFRTPTSAGALVAAHLAGLRKPPVAIVYEHFARACPVDAGAVWQGRPVTAEPISGGPAQALSIAAGIAETGASVDVHCAVFTPHSFADVLAELIGLDLLPFECGALEPTRPREDEFFVLLRKRSGGTAAQRAATVPRLDPDRHGAVPRPRWPQRVARRWRRALPGGRA